MGRQELRVRSRLRKVRVNKEASAGAHKISTPAERVGKLTETYI